jgi:transposase
VRTGWYRQVQVKSLDSHLIRTLLAARAGLVAMHRDVANQIRGALKTFGLVLGKVAAGAFEARVRQLIAGNPLLAEVLEALPKVRASSSSPCTGACCGSPRPTRPAAD